MGTCNVRAFSYGRLIIFAAIACASLAFLRSAPQNAWYVSPAGSDTDGGTMPAPFRTIQHAVDMAAPGDTIYLRGGTYEEAVHLSHSGNADARLLLTGYAGETVILDGRDTLPRGRSPFPLLLVSGDYVTVQDLTIQNSYGIGLQLEGNYGIAARITAQRNASTGIRVTRGSQNAVCDSVVYWNGKANDRSAGQHATPWAAGLSVNGAGVRYTMLHGNTVWNNWGEGLSTFNSYYVTVEDNIVFDNFATNLYVSNTTHALVQRNLAYATESNVTSGYGGVSDNFVFGDEGGVPVSSDNIAINNLVMGGARAFSCCTGAVNNVIANNTFVNAWASGIATVQLWGSGSYSNAVFQNNIIHQDGALTIALWAAPGLRHSRNLWSKLPRSAALASDDIVTDPGLAKTGPILPGQLAADWFKLLPTSPAIDKGTPVPAVNEDFFRTLRDTLPDIGAHEYVFPARRQY